MSPAILAKRLAICCLVVTATAHMEMSWPYPLHSKFNPLNSYSDIDYSMTSPLNADGSNFPCKGFQNDRPIQPTANYAAGATYNLTLAGTATHNGGSCQVSLSYDNGATFRVIKSIIGGCPLTSTYNFTIPTYAPSGNALLAWTWQNNEGNREFYMNCAEVSIMSRPYRRQKSRRSTSFDSLPFIWKANLKGINDCVTVEGDDSVYPNPGPDVEYGQGLSSSSVSSPGNCDSPSPYGQTYKDLNDSGGATSSNNSNTTTLQTGIVSSMNASATAGPVSTNQTYSDPRPTTPAKYLGHALKLLVSVQSSSTTTVTQECETTITVTLPPATYTTGDTSAFTVRPPPTATPVTDTPPDSSRPPYATNLSQYLPCIPGTFICTSSTTWATCNYNDGSVQTSETWVYGYPRQVAAGMECLSFLSPYSAATEQYGQQDKVQSGSYRDDRIVRARADDDCSSNGSLRCTNGGQQFGICDQGGWVNMGSVAAGTTCRNDAMVAT